MTDVRDILREGADINPGLPDVPQLVRRAQVARRRRAVGATVLAAAVAVVVALLGADVASLLPRATEPPVVELPVSDLPDQPGELQARVTYDTGPTGLGYQFQVPGEGWLLAAQRDGWLSLHRNDVRVNIQRWTGVVDPDKTARGPLQPSPLPDDLGGWLSGHRRLSVGPARTVQVAGADWTAYDAAVVSPLSPSPELPDECRGLPCVPLAYAGQELVEVLAGERFRVMFAPVEPGDPQEPLVLLVAYPKSRTDPGPQVDELVESLEER